MVKAMPIRTLDVATMTKFLQDLINRCSYPYSIIIDNGTNFKKIFSCFCHTNGIWLDLASIAHPKSNGQAKRANHMILRGIKPRLQVPLARAAGAWVEELPAALWSISTMPNRSTGYTPFFLVYEPKLSCLPTSSTTHRESHCMMTRITSQLCKSPRTCLNKNGTSSRLN
jgi:hypothetical protein